MPEPGNVASALGAVSLFSGLSPDELRLLAAHAIHRRFAQGELLFSEGDVCKGLHIIATGKLRIFKSSASGREQVLAVEGARLRRLVGIIEELSFATVRQRLVAVLVRLAESAGKRTEQGIEFQLPGTHQDLAHQLGTVRELVSRNLMRLQAEGLMSVDGRSITVLDLPGLSAIPDSNG
jgi:CRP/FNR family transcriptional regulator